MYKKIISILISCGIIFSMSNLGYANEVSKSNTKIEDSYGIKNKPIPMLLKAEDLNEWEIKDLQGAEGIDFFQLKTNSKYEVALSHGNKTYTYLDSADNLKDAIAIADKAKDSNGENTIPVVINKKGLIVYATEGIARIVKMKDGQEIDQNGRTINIYRNKDDIANGKSELTYVSHLSVDDVPLIEVGEDIATPIPGVEDNLMAKIEVAGVTGWIRMTDGLGDNFVVVPLNDVVNYSYYQVNSKNQLVHSISHNVSSNGTGSSTAIPVGVQPKFMVAQKSYYSYDGMYFYDNVKSLISDLKAGNHNKSVNKDNPYYNYYTYLPARSQTVYSASEINNYIDKNTDSKSVLRGTGESFIKHQDTFGINALMALGIAMNESGAGMSEIALTKNNIFGYKANDDNTSGATSFESVDECIKTVMDYLSTYYCSVRDYRYNGSNLGNKSIGFNVKYASDPYWSEKAASWMYKIDDSISGGKLKDYNNYQLGVYTKADELLSKDNKLVYSVLSNRDKNTAQVGDAVLINNTLDKTYEVNPDRAKLLSDTTSSGDFRGSHNWDFKGYIDKGSVKLINTVDNSSSNEGWKQVNGKWYYYDKNGNMVTGWLYLDKTWYYLRNNGEMATGWESVKNKWYYLEKNGAMKVDWLSLDGKWYYLDASGAMKTGWLNLSGTWYYLEDDGAMKTGWLSLGGKWYYLKGNGVMATDWEKVNGSWYYLEGNGAMKIGWLKLGGAWHYLKSNGVMATGWEKINGSWYYMYSSGVMATNTIIDGWKIDLNGVATPIK